MRISDKPLLLWQVFVWLDESTLKYKVQMKPLGILVSQSCKLGKHQYVIFLLGITNAAAIGLRQALQNREDRQLLCQ
jgi:hypothetical protein